VDDDPLAWAHSVSIKRGLNLAAVRGNGLRHFYFDGMLIKKIVALKQLIGKFLNTSAAHI
jgi:hypothetical protein